MTAGSGQSFHYASVSANPYPGTPGDLTGTITDQTAARRSRRIYAQSSTLVTLPASRMLKIQSSTPAQFSPVVDSTTSRTSIASLVPPAGVRCDTSGGAEPEQRGRHPALFGTAVAAAAALVEPGPVPVVTPSAAR